MTWNDELKKHELGWWNERAWEKWCDRKVWPLVTWRVLHQHEQSSRWSTRLQEKDEHCKRIAPWTTGRHVYKSWRSSSLQCSCRQQTTAKTVLFLKNVHSFIRSCTPVAGNERLEGIHSSFIPSGCLRKANSRSESLYLIFSVLALKHFRVFVVGHLFSV